MTLAKVYNPLGLALPTTLQGKQIYRDVCDVKASWDAPIPDSVKSRWEKWKESLPAEVNTQRPLAPYHKQVDSFELHAFGDASTIGVGFTQLYARRVESHSLSSQPKQDWLRKI